MQATFIFGLTLSVRRRYGHLHECLPMLVACNLHGSCGICSYIVHMYKMCSSNGSLPQLCHLQYKTIILCEGLRFNEQCCSSTPSISVEY